MKRLALAAAAALALVAGTASAASDRPTLGVTEFTNQSGAAWWQGGVGWELASMLSNELAATGKFKVVERSQLEAVIEEQNLGASGRVAGGTGAQIGKITGAEYLVTGTVTAYEENVKGTGGGVSFRGISLGGKSERAYLAVDIRVIDTTTGEVAFVRTIEGESKGGGVSVGVYRGGWGGTLDNYKNTPTGKAIRAAVVLTTDYLECVMIKRDGCEAQFDAADDRRRQRTRESLDID
ncbi:MAG TPA: CsgG/HfaB family protein [Xanthomonadaceae bacterium]|nr:CsgG/HfaB family protein [Xanthomonadaceae bacterium]